MSAFSNRKAPSTTSAGAVADSVQQNSLTLAGGGMIGLGVAGAAFVGGMVAPAPVIGLAATGTACMLAGNRIAQGKSIIPAMGDKQEAPASKPSKQAADKAAA